MTLAITVKDAALGVNDTVTYGGSFVPNGIPSDYEAIYFPGFSQSRIAKDFSKNANNGTLTVASGGLTINANSAQFGRNQFMDMPLYDTADASFLIVAKNYVSGVAESFCNGGVSALAADGTTVSAQGTRIGFGSATNFYARAAFYNETTAAASVASVAQLTVPAADSFADAVCKFFVVTINSATLTVRARSLSDGTDVSATAATGLVRDLRANTLNFRNGDNNGVYATNSPHANAFTQEEVMLAKWARVLTEEEVQALYTYAKAYVTAAGLTY